MGERLGSGHNLENVADHVHELQEQGRVSGGIENQGLPSEPPSGNPLGEAPGAYAMFPGELASPRSPPEILYEGQEWKDNHETPFTYSNWMSELAKYSQSDQQRILRDWFDAIGAGKLRTGMSLEENIRILELDDRYKKRRKPRPK